MLTLTRGMKMYKILNYLFGFDYIHWKNTIDSGVARIHIDCNGNVFYWKYKNIKFADHIKDASKFLWLTCSPDKYLKNSNKNV
jgi:hypothetical protein|tara:strand:- start:1103 stop:1351 length:249 start_codon:yes stop_codon:yes gene_type:complete